MLSYQHRPNSDRCLTKSDVRRYAVLNGRSIRDDGALPECYAMRYRFGSTLRALSLLTWALSGFANTAVWLIFGVPAVGLTIQSRDRVCIDATPRPHRSDRPTLKARKSRFIGIGKLMQQQECCLWARDALFVCVFNGVLYANRLRRQVRNGVTATVRPADRCGLLVV